MLRRCSHFLNSLEDSFIITTSASAVTCNQLPIFPCFFPPICCEVCPQTLLHVLSLSVLCLMLVWLFLSCVCRQTICAEFAVCKEYYLTVNFSSYREKERLYGDVYEDLVRETGWEAVMRFRCSKGLKVCQRSMCCWLYSGARGHVLNGWLRDCLPFITRDWERYRCRSILHTFYPVVIPLKVSSHVGNFFVRSSDLLALPAIDRDKVCTTGKSELGSCEKEIERDRERETEIGRERERLRQEQRER